MDHRRLFTSESVSMGHPDKVADQISDAILDAMLAKDPASRVAVETLVSTGMAVIAGEVSTEAYVDIPKIVRKVIHDIGYTKSDTRFDDQSCAVLVSINQQSPEIAMGVDTGGAGDQGMMFGFACRETPELMPLAIQLAHRLVEQQARVRRDDTIEGLRPDAKSQITVEYDAQGTPISIDTVVLSTQHDPIWNTRQDELAEQVREHIVRPVLGSWYRPDLTLHVNPTGCFEIGGPHGDAGLTGRKIIVDTYGGRGRHGGGAFSGKDPTKVDRSAAYMARYIAKNVVQAGLADQCEVQLSYAIGVAEPVSVWVECFGTETAPAEAIADAIRAVFPLTPKGIIETLGLRSPIYLRTACHGHFGRTPIQEDGVSYFAWEKTDRAEALKDAVGKSAAAVS